jgi:hypothetical protein
MACWKSHIFWFYDDLCDLSNEDHTDLASVVICVIICVIWFFRIYLLFNFFRKSVWVMPQNHTDLRAKKSCDSWPQITHVTGPLRSHGWWVDRLFKWHVGKWLQTCSTTCVLVICIYRLVKCMYDTHMFSIKNYWTIMFYSLKYYQLLY